MPSGSPVFGLRSYLGKALDDTSNETGHRAASVRHIRWSDLDVEKETIRWRAENDKIGFLHTTPLSRPALDALARLQKARGPLLTIGYSHPTLIQRSHCRATPLMVETCRSESRARARVWVGFPFGAQKIRIRTEGHEPPRSCAHRGLEESGNRSKSLAAATRDRAPTPSSGNQKKRDGRRLSPLSHGRTDTGTDTKGVIGLKTTIPPHVSK